MVDLDPQAMYAYQISATDISTAISQQNLILPAGTAKLGDRDYQVKLNSSPRILDQLNDVPVRTVNGATVYLRDVARVARPGELITLESPSSYPAYLRYQGKPVELTAREFALLHELMLNAGRVLTRERLLEQVWGYDFAGDTRAVDSAIKRLRACLRSVDPGADGIEAVRGLGYTLDIDQHS